ncbi:hypothetical protein PHYBLDRAFT_161239 [Phycomyces blakesleeanus NRRL 1555(-)]|uniref:Uncharacterized protein n=1 Tax=Phycomyces blakesleeanus (strain ATCC 8743b / DSM 1359 / FGSC 10004 / NBRC 33097 / NRRL 1555) TaxID=763407 RepID=A0A163EPB6_PHYB8|nr:hypothetical protein PHYBLDRAFT_161239 [Phycomyces blakesleeanus NRRL 1555(-)]OAD80600.1 hypothetical protein PHYBLDRAFT_161239 [Phycomyces blakesleeanus NRRL 1555(-)]|eukprot:XP_018298640.1 hypothetical protein PHYBLDRAFT_161239 [Phycomyces blakesleeanus NRRL 1555(-)]
MGRKNARSILTSKMARREGGKFCAKSPIITIDTEKEPVEDQPVEEYDWELLDLDTDTMIAAYYNSFLTWRPDAGKKLCGLYRGDSRSSIMRNKRKMKEELEANKDKKVRTLADFGFSVPVASVSPVTEALTVCKQSKDEELEEIREAYEKISEMIKPPVSSDSELGKFALFEVSKHIVVKEYFRRLLNNCKKIEASEKAAEIFWTTPSKYRGEAVHGWAKEFLQFGKISEHQQGKHAKRSSIVDDEDLKKKAIVWLRAQKAERRTVVDLKKYLDEMLFPSCLGVKGNVAISTAWKCMRAWGYVHRKNNQDVYYDGHERQDVVQYCHAWATRMMGYKQCMSDFTGEDEEIEVTPLLLENQKKLVMVTHDESTFYAHDGKVDMWLEEGESHIRKKGQGRSLMVSEFQCACHGTMRVKGWVSRRIFNVGAAYDGYWTSEDMLDQLKNYAIPLFESLHEGCTGVFIFDQSSNHKAYATDALVATRMVLKPKVVSENDKFIFKDTTFLRDGRIIPQSFYETVFEAGRKGKGPVEKRQFVGVQRILQERGLWMELDPSNLSRRWRMDCNGEEAENHCCCARHLLASQPDFSGQKTAIQEVVEEAGHIFELYPKFHCECNWIERYWGAAKRVTRLNCDYSFKSLEKNLPSFLDSASSVAGSPSMIRRFYKKTWRYIEAYSKFLDAKDADAEVKKFTSRISKSHRSIGIHD